MLGRIFCLLLLSLSMVSDALAEMKRVAVLEFRSVSMDTAYLLNLSDQSRRAAVEQLSKEEYLIMTRENMMQILSDMGKDASCMEGMCEVEIGRNVGADFIVTGDVLQIDSLYVLTLKLYDTTSGALLSTVEVEANDLISLKRDTYTQSISLLQIGLDLKTTKMLVPDVGFQGSVKADDWMISKSDLVVVQFSSSPDGAVVLVDGQMLCAATPCSKEVSKGAHAVVFQKERYYPYQMNMDTSTQVQINAALEAKFGLLKVGSDPEGVQIFLDGEKIGRTPIRSYAVDAGVHNLTMQDPCFVGPEYRFQMKPGGIEDVVYPLTSKDAGISVRAMDREGNALAAQVELDGKNLGVTPLTEKVPLCSQDLRVSIGRDVQKPKLALKEREVFEIEVLFGSKMVEAPRKKTLHSVEVWRKSGLMMGASLLLYGATVLSYNDFMDHPRTGMFVINRSVHTGGVVLTTASVGILMKHWLTGDAS